MRHHTFIDIFNIITPGLQYRAGHLPFLLIYLNALLQFYTTVQHFNALRASEKCNAEKAEAGY